MLTPITTSRLILDSPQINSKVVMCAVTRRLLEVAGTLNVQQMMLTQIIVTNVAPSSSCCMSTDTCHRVTGAILSPHPP